MDATDTRKQLDLIRIIAVADAALLVVLVLGLILDWNIKGIVGPIHGVGFLALVYLTARGAAEDRWGWWFPAIVVVTAGPPGSLIGDVKIRRELAAATT